MIKPGFKCNQNKTVPSLLPCGAFVNFHLSSSYAIRKQNCLFLSYQTVPVVSPSPIEIGQVTVLVPPGTAVGQGTVAQGDVVVWVDGGPGPAQVVGHGITCERDSHQ